MNALILAAGLGTRLGVLTSDTPKALVEVAGRTMLEHQLRHLHKAGFDHFVINVHHFADKITDFLDMNDSFGLDITISDERGMLLDTGGGIRQAMHLFRDDSPVLVHNVDIFSDTDLAALYNVHVGSGADATLLTSRRTTSRYLHFDERMNLRGWSNEKSGETRSPFPDFDRSNCTPLAFQGIHVISRTMLERLDAVEADRFSITDFYIDNAAGLSLKAVVASAQMWVDAGKQDSLPLAGQIIKNTGYEY